MGEKQEEPPREPNREKDGETQEEIKNKITSYTKRIWGYKIKQNTSYSAMIQITSPIQRLSHMAILAGYPKKYIRKSILSTKYYI